MRVSFNLNEINHHALKLMVGVVALTLGNLTAFLSATAIESISASYYEDGSARDFFVGLLFTISAFLFAYNGSSILEMVLAKIAAVAGIGIAIFPCSCGTHQPIIPYVHYASAAIMFLVLACYCWIFYGRARKKSNLEAALRRYIYAACGITIVLAIAVLAIDAFAAGLVSSIVPRLTFYGERAGLIAFGVSWLVASRTLPFITSSEERVSILPILIP